MILHDHKLIFIHIPKCAGTSIATLFNAEITHDTAYNYEIKYPDQWNNYNKFTIVRNPFDRFVSLYHYTIINPYKLSNPLQILASKGFKPWLIESIEKYQGDFFHSPEGARNTQSDIGSSFWFSSQARRLMGINGRMCPDIKIFKLEDGIKNVNKFLGNVTGKKIIVPHKNSSSHNHFSKYYDSELANIVSNFAPVKEDCLLLEYERLNSSL